eukprot:COSAG02_NODE_14238_length_1294_cov_3.361506_2_plen_260_part_00
MACKPWQLLAQFSRYSCCSDVRLHRWSRICLLLRLLRCTFRPLPPRRLLTEGRWLLRRVLLLLLRRRVEHLLLLQPLSDRLAALASLLLPPPPLPVQSLPLVVRHLTSLIRRRWSPHPAAIALHLHLVVAVVLAVGTPANAARVQAVIYKSITTTVFFELLLLACLRHALVTVCIGEINTNDGKRGGVFPSPKKLMPGGQSAKPLHPALLLGRCSSPLVTPRVVVGLAPGCGCGSVAAIGQGSRNGRGGGLCSLLTVAR